MSKTTDTNKAILKKLVIYNAEKGRSVDLINIFIELKIWMSIDTPCHSGNVIVEEQTNTINNLPIYGCEYIEVEFTANEEYESYHRVFFVYSVTNAMEFLDKKRYIIHFTDVMGLINNDTRLSIKYTLKAEDIIAEVKKVIEYEYTNTTGSYTNKPYNTILKNFSELYSSNHYPFNFITDSDLSVKSMFDIDIVVPYWKPFTLINYVVSHAVSDTNEQISLSNSSTSSKNVFSDCLFFQNRKGQYLMTSYKKMFTASNRLIELNKKVGNIESGKQEKYSVVKFSINNLFNTQLNKFSGLCGATIVISDFAYDQSKITEIKESDINDMISKYLNISGNNRSQVVTFKKSTRPIFIYEACSINTPSIYTTGTAQHMKYDEFVLPYQKGRILSSYIRANTVNIEMNGASDIDIGIPVKINLGGSTDTNSRSMGELCKEKTWVVSKVHHTINNELNFSTFVECFTPYWNYPI